MRASDVVFKCIGSLFLCIFLSPGLAAQDWQVRHYTVNDGLPHNVGYDMHQDKQGYMWLGTDLGLARFNGTDFTNFGTDEGLEGLSIITLGETPQGKIWCSVYEKGVYIQEGNRFELSTAHTREAWYHPTIIYNSDTTFFSHDIRPDLHSAFTGYGSAGLGQQYAYWYFRDKQLQYSPLNVVALSESKRLKFWSNIESEPDIIFHLRFCRNPEGKLLVGCEHGAFIMNENHKPAPFHPALLDIPVWSLHADEEGNTVFASDDKLFLVSAQGVLQTFHLPQNITRPPQIRLTADGFIYGINEDRNQIWGLDTRQGTFSVLSDQVDLPVAISYIETDRLGGLWVSTDGDGCYVFRRSFFHNMGIDVGLRNLFINDFHVDESGKVWVAHKKGLQLLEESPKGIYKLMVPDTFLRREVNTIRKGPKGNLYIVGQDGIWELYPTKTRLFPYKVPDFSIHPSGEFILSLARGLYLQAPGKDSSLYTLFANFQSIGDYFFLVDHAYHTYWGNKHGLFYLKPSSGPRAAVDTFSLANIVDATIAPNGDLIFGNEDSLYIKKPSAPVQAFSLDKKSLGILHQIAVGRNGEIWLGTTKGLHHWGPDVTYTFLQGNGLVSDNITRLYFDQKDQMWIGSSKGISLLRKPELLQKENPPQLYLASINLDGQVVDSSLLNLVTSRSNISLDFDAIEFQNPKELRYQFRLWDSDPWQDISVPILTLSNLSPKAYQLSFRARSPQSDWGKAINLSFEIRPPMWQQWWFMGGCLLLLIFLAFLIIRSRISNIRKRAAAQNELNQQMAHLQLSALQAQLNPHFLFNALNAIQYFILQKDEVTANDFLAKFSRLMRLFLEASHARYISLHEEIELLELYIDLERLRFDEHFEYEIKIAPSIDLDEVELPSMMLQPFVENAINHGLRYKGEKGFLSIYFSGNEEELLCTIEDNGIGREAANEIRMQTNKEHQSRGMQLLENKLDLLRKLEDADIQMDTMDLFAPEGKAAGTRILIRFSLKR